MNQCGGKKKSSNCKYVALSPSDTNNDIPMQNTCESSPLLQNMENDGLVACTSVKCSDSTESTSRTSLVRIHRKTKMETNKSVDQKLTVETESTSIEETENANSFTVSEDSTENHRKTIDDNKGIRDESANTNAEVDISEKSRENKSAGEKLDIVRKMSDLSLGPEGNWKRVGKYGSLKTRRCQRLYAKTGRNDDLALFHVNGRFYAMEAWCTHMGGPLFSGDIENYNGRCHVMCPWHSYMFDLETGKNEIGLQQKVYEMKYDNGYVYIDYHTELTTEPIDRQAAPPERKITMEARKTSVLESPFKLSAN